MAPSNTSSKAAWQKIQTETPPQFDRDQLTITASAGGVAASPTDASDFRNGSRSATRKICQQLPACRDEPKSWDKPGVRIRAKSRVRGHERYNGSRFVQVCIAA
jgi:hypothetical protein